MNKTCIKRIEVRYGYIEVDLFDSSSQFDDFARASEMAADGIEAGNMDEAEAERMVAAKFEGIFGARSCQKTFGTDTPSILQFAEFWDKFSPLLEKWLKE